MLRRVFGFGCSDLKSRAEMGRQPQELKMQATSHTLTKKQHHENLAIVEPGLREKNKKR